MKAKDYLAVNYVFFPPLFEYYRLLYKKKKTLAEAEDLCCSAGTHKAPKTSQAWI